MRLTHVHIGVLLLVLLSAMAVPAEAQVRVESRLSQREIALHERVELTVRVTGAAPETIRDPRSPLTTGLVPRRPARRTETAGAVEFSWIYEPVSTGTATISGVEVTVNGQRLHTAEHQVSVTSNRSAPAAEPGITTGRDIFIAATPDRETAFVHEQVTVEYRLFFRSGVQLRQSRLAGSWDAPGFWREELDVDLRPAPDRRLVDNIVYNSILLKRVAMFPTRSGRLSVDPLRIETEVRPRHGSDFFDSFFAFGNRYRNIELESPPIQIDVRPLPAGAPPGFTGAVGDFDVNFRTSSPRVSQGEAVHRRIDIQGTGNLAMIEPPPVPETDDFDVFPPRVADRIDRSGRALRGDIAFQYSSVPRRAGNAMLPGMSFAYFDPASETYRTIESPSILVIVEGGEDETTEQQVIALAPIRHDGAFEPAPPPLHRRPWAYAPFGLAALAWLLMPGIRRVDAARSDKRRRSANRRRIAGWRSELRRLGDIPSTSPQKLRAYEQLARSITSALVGSSASSASLYALRNKIQASAAPAAVNEPLAEAIQAIEDVQFMPGHLSGNELTRTHKKLSTCVEALDG